MKTQDPNLDRQPAVYAKRSHAHPGIAFVSTLAFILSLLSLGVSGFLAYRFLDLQQAFGVVNSALNRDPGQQGANAPNQPQATTQPTQPSGTASGIQPGQLVQPIEGGNAQIELLSVNRIQNPTSQTRDVVNVQFRVRRTSPQGQANPATSTINPGQISARNPNTGEAYQPVAANQATDSIAISPLPVNASVDGYVWLRVPEGVSTIDLQIPNTQGFKNVPIAN